ncbi:hypothetical protein AQ611_13645 [Burkholderia singularis]|nr:hypothetical protein AQ611_13645 [Burkholderia sp. Bp7605]
MKHAPCGARFILRRVRPRGGAHVWLRWPLAAPRRRVCLYRIGFAVSNARARNKQSRSAAGKKNGAVPVWASRRYAPLAAA